MKRLFKFFKSKFFNLTKGESIWFSVLIGWLIIHIMFFYKFQDNYSTKYFWPFDMFSQFSRDYGFDELQVYGIMPIIIFLIYKLLNKTNY